MPTLLIISLLLLSMSFIPVSLGNKNLKLISKDIKNEINKLNTDDLQTYFSWTDIDGVDFITQVRDKSHFHS